MASGNFNDIIHDLRLIIKNPYARRIYEYILSNNPIFFRQKLTRVIGLNIDTINRWIKISSSIGTGFIINIDFEKIGLTQVAFKFNNQLKTSSTERITGLPERSKWFLRWKADAVFPDTRSLLISFAPLSTIGIDTILKDYALVGEIDDYFIADSYIPNKLPGEFFECDYKYKICMNNWKQISEHLKKIADTFDKREEFSVLNKKRLRKKRHRIDLLDLLMLSHLEENALYRPQELATKTKSTVLKINRHLRKHILYPQIINGTRIRYGRGMGKTMAVFSFWGKDEPSRTRVLLNEISRIYGFISGVLNSKSGKFMFMLGVPGHEIFEYAEYMPNTFKELFSEIEAYQLDKFSIRSYTIPYIPFDRFNKEWSLSEEVIVETKESLMKKGLI